MLQFILLPPVFYWPLAISTISATLATDTPLFSTVHPTLPLGNCLGNPTLNKRRPMRSIVSKKTNTGSNGMRRKKTVSVAAAVVIPTLLMSRAKKAPAWLNG